MESKPTIFLSIEHSHREIYSKTLLSYQLALAGFRCYLGGISSVLSAMSLCEHAVLFHKSTSVDILDKLRKLGHGVVFLDEEAGFAIPRSVREDFLSWRYETCNRGDYLNSYSISTGYSFAINKIIGDRLPTLPTGWPRFDLLHPRYMSLDNKISNRNFEILLISSFGAVSEKTFERLMLTEPVESQREINKFRWESFNRHLDLLAKLDKIREGVSVKIRPHPSEPLAVWKEVCGKYSNIGLDLSTDISKSLKNSKLIINPGSTAAVQGALMGIPSVSYMSPERLGITDTPVFEISYRAHSAQELLDVGIEMSTNGPHRVREAALQILENEVENLSEGDATAKIVSSLLEMNLPPIRSVKLDFSQCFKRSVEVFGTKALSRAYRVSSVEFLERFNRTWSKRPTLISEKVVSDIAVQIGVADSLALNRVTTSTVFPDLVKVEIE